jgi:uncharacterized damage-inducible protein DinB
MTADTSVAAAQQDDLQRTPAELIAAYEQGAAALRAAVSGLTADQLRARPVPGRWSMLELFCHVADCEQFFADRMKRTAAMDRPLLIGADGFRYSDALRYPDHDVEEEILLVEITRRQMAHVLRLLPAEAWQRTAIHSETGLVTLRQLLLHANNHLDHHLAFAAEKRRALGVSPTSR